MKNGLEKLTQRCPTSGWQWMTTSDYTHCMIPYSTLISTFKFRDVSDTDRGYLEFYDPTCRVYYRITYSGYLYKRKSDSWYDLNAKDEEGSRIYYKSYSDALEALVSDKAWHTFKLSFKHIVKNNSILRIELDAWKEMNYKNVKKIKKLKKRLKKAEFSSL